MRDADSLWRQADELLNRLLDLPDAEREAALAAGTTDAEIRELVSRLLEAHRSAAGMLDAPFVAPAAAQDLLRGRCLGRWQLDAQIGTGGTSVVYRAHSIAEFPRRVAAVKVLTLVGLAGPGLERFRREQQLLSQLQHAHICALLDAGVADDGSAWFAMTLVEGERIDLWCQKRNLEVRQIVDLVLNVCDAVAYAHRNLIIHRDLKPSNVLVDQEGHVRLLDFGIARLADSTSREMTSTLWRQLTPDYAAPEQFVGAPPSTAMDVYGLGALLYAILTGVAPRKSNAPSDAAITPPSQVSAEAAGRADTNALSRLRELRGDLDAIVLKALASDPEHRYASVTALMDDLDRWREGRPVAARLPTAAYRLGKLARRHRLGLSALAMVLVSILALIVNMYWQNRRVEAAAAQAQAEASRANASRELLLDLFRATGPAVVGGAPPDLVELLSRGEAVVRDSSILAPAVRADLLTTLGVMYFNQGRGDDAERLLDQAHLIAANAFPRTANERYRPRLERMRLLSSGKRQREAVGEARALVDELRANPDSPPATLIEALTRLGQSRFELDPHDGEARASVLEAVRVARANSTLSVLLGDALQLLAQIDRARGELESSEQEAREAVALLERGGSEARLPYAVALQTLGMTLQLRQKRVEALRYLERGLALSREIFGTKGFMTAKALNDYAMELALQGHYARALEAFEEVNTIERHVMGEGADPTSTLNLGVLLADMGRFGESAETLARALAEWDKEFPKTHEKVLNTLTELAGVYELDGRRAKAAELFDEYEQRLAATPAGKPATRMHHVATSRLARFRLLQGDATASLHWAAVARTGLLRATAPNDPMVADCHVTESRALKALGRDAEAALALERAVAVIDSVDAASSFVTHRALIRAARAAHDIGRHDLARTLLQRSDAARNEAPLSQRWAREHEEISRLLAASETATAGP